MDIVEQLDKLLSNMGYVKVADADLTILDKTKTEQCREVIGVAGACESSITYETVLHETPILVFPFAIYLHHKFCLESDCMPQCRIYIEIIGESDNYSETLYKIEGEGCIYI